MMDFVDIAVMLREVSERQFWKARAMVEADPVADPVKVAEVSAVSPSMNSVMFTADAIVGE